MSNEAKNLSKLLHFTESLCAFADDVADYEYHDCLFNVEIDDDKFQFDLPELVAEIRKYHQAVIDDTENCSDAERSNEVADKPKSVIHPAVKPPTSGGGYKAIINYCNLIFLMIKCKA